MKMIRGYWFCEVFKVFNNKVGYFFWLKFYGVRFCCYIGGFVFKKKNYIIEVNYLFGCV